MEVLSKIFTILGSLYWEHDIMCFLSYQSPVVSYAGCFVSSTAHIMLSFAGLRSGIIFPHLVFVVEVASACALVLVHHHNPGRLWKSDTTAFVNHRRVSNAVRRPIVLHFLLLSTMQVERANRPREKYRLLHAHDLLNKGVNITSKNSSSRL